MSKLQKEIFTCFQSYLLSDITTICIWNHLCNSNGKTKSATVESRMDREESIGSEHIGSENIDC